MSPRYDVAKHWVCRCMQVSECSLREATATCELRSLQDVIRETGAGSGCNGCHNRLKQYLAQQAG